MTQNRETEPTTNTIKKTAGLHLGGFDPRTLRSKNRPIPSTVEPRSEAEFKAYSFSPFTHLRHVSFMLMYNYSEQVYDLLHYLRR